MLTAFQLIVAFWTESLGRNRGFTQSVGSYADCLHRMEHVLSYLIVCIGNVIEKRKKDENYTYGYGRHEYLYVCTLHLSVVIVRLSVGLPADLLLPAL